MPSVVAVLVTGSFLDGEFGRGVDLQARIWDGGAALDGEAVRAVLDALLCAVEGTELLAKAGLDSQVDRRVLEGLSTIGVSVAGITLGCVVLCARIRG